MNKVINRELPILYNRKEECCGCTACFAVCPKNAINMCPDSEGFYYPIICEKKCVRCFRCISVCPIKHSVNLGNLNSVQIIRKRT